MNKLIKFRIKNYKSILDSGECYFDDGVTILAGKNESGKTSILEALEDFDTGRPIRESAKPIKARDAVPEISITFQFDSDSVADTLKTLGLDGVSTYAINLTLTKRFPDKYLIEPPGLESVGLSENRLRQKALSRIESGLMTLGKIFSAFPGLGEMPDIDFSDAAKAKIALGQFRSVFEKRVSSASEPVIAGQAGILMHIDDLGQNLDQISSLSNFENEFLKTITARYVPNFILFSSFDDVFPNKVPFTDLAKNEWIKNLAVISDLDVDTITGSGDREKHRHKKDLNIRLNKDYAKFWDQDVSNLSIDWDSNALTFWIEEEGYPYEPSLRSKGRQWHLAFYVKVSARARESVPNVILIDEPGLFLHAKAQENILALLEDSARETQLMFSTHSPYLLQAEKLHRIRLVLRTHVGGTRVENKVHALADKETLTPILTAIGLELNQDIASTDKIDNVVVEGPSDTFYLAAFKLLLKRDKLNFIFGGGAGNMPVVGTILHGWGCNVLYLYDNDKGKKDGLKNAVRNWRIDETSIHTVTGSGTIEDVFDPRDFAKFVIGDASAKFDGLNSEYLKEIKADKVLLAKKFLAQVLSDLKSVSLFKATTDKFTLLFEALEQSLSKQRRS